MQRLFGERQGRDVAEGEHDAGKIGRELGWQPQETFDTGIRKTVEWYLDNAAWCERVTSGKYRQERLGTSL